MPFVLISASRTTVPRPRPRPGSGPVRAWSGGPG